MFANLRASYMVAAALLVVALALGFLTLGVGRWAGTTARPPSENPPPEHGGRTGHKTWVQFRVRYLMVALLFGAFDMEMVYMFPWAVVFKRVGLVAFLDIFVFIIILIRISVGDHLDGASRVTDCSGAPGQSSPAACCAPVAAGSRNRSLFGHPGVGDLRIADAGTLADGGGVFPLTLYAATRFTMGCTIHG